MYESYFNLKQAPFRLTPDPKFFYEGGSHRQGMAYLRYALQLGEGFVVITGSPGTGKTELLQTLISELSVENAEIASIVSSNLDAAGILKMLAASFGLAQQGLAKADLLLLLEGYLVDATRAGKRVLVIIDEAHHLSLSALAELSMLANLQSAGKPLLQCFLAGQECLKEKINDHSMVFLKQRIVASAQLVPLTRIETQDYIKHRLKHVGWQSDPTFSKGVFSEIYEISSGVPRQINHLLNRLLLQAYVTEKHQIDHEIVQKTADEMMYEDLIEHTSYVFSENCA